MNGRIAKTASRAVSRGSRAWLACCRGFQERAPFQSCGRANVHSLRQNMNTSIVSPNVRMGRNFSLGMFNIIEADAEFGDNVSVGNFCHIASGVVIGDNTVLMDYVELRRNT